MGQELQTSITYYVSRLLYEYSKQRAQDTIAILIKQALADGLPWQLANAFNLSTATGKQLDILGKYIGLPRSIGDPTPLPFFGFVRYDGIGNNPNGMTSYLNENNSNVVFYQYGYNGANPSDLSDAAYAYLLLFKIFLNTSDSTLYGIQLGLLQYFKGSVTVRDNLDMTLTYFVGGGIPVSPAVLLPYLPRPMGVGITGIVMQFNIVTGDGDQIVTGDGDHIIAGNN